MQVGWFSSDKSVGILNEVLIIPPIFKDLDRFCISTGSFTAGEMVNRFWDFFQGWCVIKCFICRYLRRLMTCPLIDNGRFKMLLKCLAQRLRISAFSVISVLLSALKKGSDPEKLSQRKSWEQGRFSHVISVSKTLELKCFIAQTWVPSLLEFVLHYSTNVIESVFLGKKL